MNERVYRDTKTAVELFCKIQDTRTKEEAFLKGLLFGLGGESIMPRPNFELIAKNPDMIIPIEKNIEEISRQVMNEQIEATQIILEELYEKEGRATPPWLK